jgi:E3 ubiquitin-protein ligase RFWD3
MFIFIFRIQINFLDYKLNQYVPIHSKLIRDISTLNDDSIILTCGMDKMIKLTNIANNTHVHSYECPAPIWSCTYNLDNPIYFYAGMQSGQVLRFDKRKIDKHVDILNSELNNYSPVSNLQFVPKNNQYSRSSSGILVSQLDKLCFYEMNANGEYKYHPLLIENNIMSISFEPITGHLLVSTRPSQKHSTVRNLIYELTLNHVNGENVYSLNLIQNYVGGPVQKLLARSKLFYHNQQLYGCAPDEPSKSALIWDVSRNETIAKLANSGEIYDVCPIWYNNCTYISTLTDKQLRVFKQNSD